MTDPLLPRLDGEQELDDLLDRELPVPGRDGGRELVAVEPLTLTAEGRIADELDAAAIGAVRVLRQICQYGTNEQTRVTAARTLLQVWTVRSAQTGGGALETFVRRMATTSRDNGNGD